MEIRRVVTGQQDDGRSVFVVDEVVEPITTALMPGAEFHQIWSSDATVQLPTDGTPPGSQGYFPREGGFRFGFFTLPPASTTPAADLDVAAAIAEFNDKLPGMLDVMEPGAPGMHTTDTIDFDVVISGEVWLELDDGEEVRLTPGSAVVQNGTRHAWHNRSDAAVTLAVALIGARRT